MTLKSVKPPAKFGDVTKEDAGLGEVSGIVGRRVRETRTRLGWSIERLADACSQAGASELTVNALYALEGGRRDRATGRRRRHVTVDELLVLAAAMETYPADLLVPRDLPDDAPYQLSPGISTTAARARRWIEGRVFLVAPETLPDLADATRGMSVEGSREAAAEWLTPERQAQLAWRLPSPTDAGEADQQEGGTRE